MTCTRSELNGPCRRYLASKEKYLGRRCTKLWWATNRLGESFLFARLGAGDERVIVTIGHYRVEIHEFVPTL